METQKDCFVSGALALVLRLSRFVGIAPLRFVKKKTGWRVSLSTGWSLYGYFIVTAVILITMVALISDLHVEQGRSVRMRTNTRRVVWVVDATLMVVIAATAVFGAPGQMRSMMACLNHVQKINHELNVDLWPMSLERRMILLFIVWVLITVALTCVDHVHLTSTIYLIDAEVWISVMYSFYYCCYWILQLREMLFIMITLKVKYSFKAVNDRLRNLLRVTAVADFKNLYIMGPFSDKFKVNQNYRTSFNNYVNSMADLGRTDLDGIMKSTRPHHETVRRLALIYASVCDVVREVDRCHGLMMLLMLGSFLLHLVCSPYYLINNLFDDKTSQTLMMHILSAVLQLLWCLYHAANLLMVVEPCHLTHIEMEISRELVSQLMCCTQSVYDPLAVELELFFRHLILNQVSYSPLKVTTMSRSLVATILGSITTYLVVITQL